MPHKKAFYRQRPLNKAMKAVLPMMAMLGGGAVASTRNPSSSINGQRLKSHTVFSSVNSTGEKTNKEGSLAHKSRRSAFGAFTNSGGKKNPVKVVVDNKALSFLNDNGLLQGGNNLKANLSGNTLGRKTFVDFCLSVNPSAYPFAPSNAIGTMGGGGNTIVQAGVMSGFAAKASCTAGGNLWLYTTAGVCSSMAATYTMPVSCVSNSRAMSGFNVTAYAPLANAAPTVTGAPSDRIVIEDTASDVDLSALTFADGDGDSLTVTLAVDSGTIASSDGSGGPFAGVTIANSGTASMTLAGLAGAINTYLDTTTKIVYTSASNDSGNDAAVLTVSATDGTASLASDPTINLDITAVNDEPTLTATGSDPTFTEGGGSSGLFSAASASTIEGAQSITGLTLTVTNVNDGADEILSFDGSNIQLTHLFNDANTTTNNLDVTVTVAVTTATVSFSGESLTELQIETLVNAITYSNANDDPNTSNRVVTITSITDDGANGGGDDNTSVPGLVSTVTITAANDTGNINFDLDDSSGAGGNNYSTSYNAGGGAVTIGDTDVTITDVDDTNMESGQILLSGGVLDGANESISISGTPGTVGGVTITYTSATQIDLSGSATLSDYQDAIEAIIYANGAAITAVTAGARTVTATVNDGDIDTNTATSTITVAAAPQVTSATYDEDSKNLVVTGTNFIVSGGDDVDVTQITLTGEAGGTYTLTGATANVEIDSATQFTVTIAGVDIAGVEALLNLNGTSPDTGAAYNIAVGDDFITAYTDGTTSDATGNGVTVSGLPSPTITSATYDYSTGDIVVTGVDFESKVGGVNDVTAIAFTITGEDGATYSLTDTADVDRDSATQFTLDLSPTDEAAVNAIINKDGADATGGQAYNIAAADNFIAEILVGNTADATNAITVSNVAAPTITSATYDGAAGVFLVTGADIPSLTGGTNDIVAANFTFTGANDTDIGTYTLVGSSDVERTSATGFSITLDVTDKAEIQKRINMAGLTSTGGITYNLSGAEDWAAGADAAVNVVDSAGNAVTVSNVPAPTITSVTYSEDSKDLVVTGTNFVGLDGATNDIDITMLTLVGEAGGTYQLTATTSDVEIDSVTQFTVAVAGADIANVEALLNANGTQSHDATAYELDAADDYNAGHTDNSTVDADNVVTVSGWPQPSITSATYDAVTGLLVVTGVDFTAKVGGANDVDASLFIFTGEGGATYQLTDTTDVEIGGATTFTIDISTSSTDHAAVNAIINKDLTDATGGQSYNIGALDDFMAFVTDGDTSDTAGNAITVSNVVAPVITAVAYNASTGVLSVTGTNIPNVTGLTNDIDASLFTFTGEGGGTYALSGTPDVERTSDTSFALTLDITDKAAVQELINKNGLTSTSGTTYNLNAAEDWSKGADAAVNVVDATNAITVSSVPSPSISSATYNSSSELLVVTGLNMLKKTGAANDIDVSTLTFTGEGGGTYNLSTSSDVELTDSTSFSLTLVGGDIAAVENLLHINGTTSDSGQTYNMAAAEDWNTGADVAINISDGAAPVTVSGYPVPNITSATYNANTGELVVTGANFEAKTGGINDIDISTLTFTGQSGATYTLTSTDDVERDGGSPTTQFNVTLTGADKTAVDNILNKNGASSADATTYNLAAADDFNANVLLGDTSDTLATIAVSAVAPVVTVPASAIDVNAATQVISGTFTTNTTTISLYLDTGNDGTPDGGALGTDNVAGGTWSIIATLADDTVFDYLIVADQGGGNESLYMDVPTINEDSTAPVGYSAVIDTTINAGNETALSFTFAGAEVGTTYDYVISTDGGAGTAVGSGTIATATDNITAINVSAVEDGTLTLSVTLTDDASNIGIAVLDTEDKNTFVPPVINTSVSSITQINSALTNANSVDYGINFAATVTGLSATNFSLNTEGVVGSVISAVTGAGASYIITIDTGTGDGMIQLELVNDTNLSPGLSNAPLLSGTYIIDKTPPNVISAIDPQQVSLAGDTLTFNLSDADIGDTYSYILSSGGGGSVTGEGVVGESGVVNGVDTSSLGEGEWSLVVSITDAAGNVITLDTVSYTVPIGKVDSNGRFTKLSLQALQSLGLASVDDDISRCTDCRVRDGAILFKPGRHELTWTLAPAILEVWPLVSFGKSKTISEGDASTADFFLNGSAPRYPFTVSYLVAGTTDSNDHSLTSGNAVFVIGSPTSTAVAFTTTGDDGNEGDEIIELSFASDAINDSVQNTQTITISEENVAPEASLLATQSGTQGLIFSNASESASVVVLATVTDGNAGDTHVHNWSVTGLTDTDSEDTSFTFDPSGLDEGSYEVSLTVTDSGIPQETGNAAIYIVIKADLPILSSTADSDNDGLTDAEEGLADTDSDGVPDYLDPPLPANILPTVASEPDIYLVECDPGADCRLGSFAIQGENSGVQLSTDDQEDLLEDDKGYTNSGGVFDFAGTLPEAGDSLRIVIPLRTAIPAKALYRKYTVENGWTDFVIGLNNNYYSTEGDEGSCPPPGDDIWTEGLTEGHLCLQLEIEDGGANDSDGEANGTVVDPGGVSILVSTNSLPEINNDLAQTVWNTSVTIDVLANDTDPDGDVLTVQSASVDFGNVVIDNEQLIYTPPTDFSGVATINYSVSDNNGGTGNAQVSVTIMAYEVIVVTNSSGGGGSIGYLTIILGSLLLMCRSRKFKQAKQRVIALSCLCLVSFNSQANWQLDATIGQAKAKSTTSLSNELPPSVISNIDETDTSWSLGVGYQFNNGVRLSTHYLDMGEGAVTITAESLTPAQYHQAVSKTSPVLVNGVAAEVGYGFWQGESFGGEVFVGVLAWDSDIVSRYNSQILKFEQDGTDGYYGVKGFYQLAPKWQIGLGIKRYTLAPNDVDNIYLSLGYEF